LGKVAEKRAKADLSEVYQGFLGGPRFCRWPGFAQKPWSVWK
jgi:hypothetical protein